MKPTFFPTASALRRWLERHHETESVLLVGFYKKGSGRASITWPESVDEALCFGWIDGVRKSIDAESYSIRFTPRRRGSAWSAINLRKVEALIASGRMRPAGLRAFEERDPRKSGTYSFERAAAQLSPEAEAEFRASPAAWTFFQSQPPGYRKLMAWWIVSAKQEATRMRRLRTLIAESAAGRRIGLLGKKDDPRRPPG